MDYFFCTVSIALFSAGFLNIYFSNNEKRFSLALIQTLLGLILLSVEYLYFTYTPGIKTARVIGFSEIIFSLIWFSFSLRLRSATEAQAHDTKAKFIIEIIIGSFIAIIGFYYIMRASLLPGVSETLIKFGQYSPVYYASVFILMSSVYGAWRMEQFWRSLEVKQRRQYMYLVVGFYLVGGAMAWSASYRLTYLTIFPRHLGLLAALFLFGWTLIAYAVVHHRLLNRKIFVSRKVVYSFLVPLLLAAYLLVFGIVSLVIVHFGLELDFLLKWLFIVFGFVLVGIFAFSGRLRRRVHFFISTHFYINKYEYRDEWLALSQSLEGAVTENEVVDALRQVLYESLYTADIFIWVGDSLKGYHLASNPESFRTFKGYTDIYYNDPIVMFIETHAYYDAKEKEPDGAWRELTQNKKDFFSLFNLALLSPVSIGNSLVGFIGLGPEYTGGEYGYDDFDLLAALGSQTASALLAVSMAEELAKEREKQAWNRLSAFVLHDIKNAATMLSMLQTNAPAHIHKPEFQKDMLELVDDTLKRMARVENHLKTLKDDIKPQIQLIELSSFLNECRKKIAKKLKKITITVNCNDVIYLHTDPEIFFSILENLTLNAFEAKSEETTVNIQAQRDNVCNELILHVKDNGPGIPEEMLPRVLFEPFKTTKESGSGIGLWQTKKNVNGFGGSISAENTAGAGAIFIIRLPLTNL